VLLVPANPSLRRTIRDGRYWVDGRPLDQTAFARDPHHPARTAVVTALLGSGGRLPVSVAKPTDPLPTEGIVVGEVTTSADVDAWADRLDAETLAAGGGEFFAAWLRQRGQVAVACAAPGTAAPVLLVSGSTAPACRAAVARAVAEGLPVLPLPPALVGAQAGGKSADDWAETVAAMLRRQGRTVVAVEQPLPGGATVAMAIRVVLANLIHCLNMQQAFGHLIIEGGATAAALVEATGWTDLLVRGEWAQGIVSLQPAGAAGITVTMKPGSYAWPEALWVRLAGRPSAASPDPSR
jgi:uncharacterized protein YgbK (DUF1537 family)